MASVMTYRVYRRMDRDVRMFMGIVAVPLDVPESERKALEMAKNLWGSPYKYGSDYEIECQGID